MKNIDGSTLKLNWLAFLPVLFLMVLLAVTACTSIDCPANQSVNVRFVLKGEVDTLRDTMTIRAIRQDGTDTIVYNKGVNITFFSIRMSYTQDFDRLALLFKAKDGREWKDTISLSKTNSPHFEAVDCSPAYFHTLTSVNFTSRYISDAVINNPNVDYDTNKEHIYLYLRPHD